MNKKLTPLQNRVWFSNRTRSKLDIRDAVEIRITHDIWKLLEDPTDSAFSRHIILMIHDDITSNKDIKLKV